MKIARRLRMLALVHRADANNRRARERLNRPHQQSPHMISYPVPEQEDGYRLRTVYSLAGVAMLALVVYVNFYYDGPAGLTPYACAQVASR